MIPAFAAAGASPDSAVTLSLQGGGSSAVKLFLLLTVLSFATSLLISVTSFTRIIIVLSFLRQALGTQQLPPSQVMVGLALVLSGFVMAPTGTKVWEQSLQPYLEDKITTPEAIDRASGPVRTFLLRQTREQDLALFYDIAGRERPARGEAIPLTIAAPAFMVSELTTAFRMGLFLYIPLLLVDVMVAGILMSLGMMMVPPPLVSLPVKVAVFVMADGWRLVVASLVRSFS
ncbi:MAG TPA: flagellar type III secretion system pore protein FliP [Anaeromyxobacteraceae bacterium]|nr:flagellar type III secretion system pore protein FliP [Anaeromyxobacteraceae bacterium]